MHVVAMLARGPSRLAAGLVAAVALNGCIISVDVEDVGMFEGGWSESERDLSSELTKIDYEGQGTLYVVQGDDPRLRLQGNRAALDAVTIRQSGGTLHIAERPTAAQCIGWACDIAPGLAAVGDISYYLEIPFVEDIRHSGHGELKVGPLTAQRLVVVVEDHADTKFSSLNVRNLSLRAQDHADINVETLDADEASLSASSHADIYAHDVNTLELTIHADDQGQVWLAGRADEADISVADHASLDASRVECDVVNIRAADHAVARLWAEESLHIRSHDQATVDWSGNAEVRERTAVSGR